MEKYFLALTGLLFLSGFLARAQTAPTSPPRTGPAQTANDGPTDPQAIKQFNDEKVAEVLKQIAGKEEQPAGTVFKNIQRFAGVPAGRMLRIMQTGFSNSLGVSCAHCHVPGQWEKEDKPAKQVARDMGQMVQNINNDLLKKIKNLKDPNPVVNCTTCHRGQVKPALDLNPSPGK